MTMFTNPGGYLHLLYGPMFSGKTSALVQQYRLHSRAGFKVVVVNHSLDVRYSSTHLTTHDGTAVPCTFATHLSDISKHIDDVDVILINEGQFFDDLKETVLDWVENKKKIVWVGGLDGTSDRTPFGQMLSLIPYADSYEKLRSICESCGKKDAPFTYRDKALSNGQDIQVGVKEYKPMCRTCYLKASTETL
jgi:thymidine kinase